MTPERLAEFDLVVFDADDTLRRTTVPGQPSPRRDGEWELMPNVRETLVRVPWASGRPRLGLASNQDQIGYGHLSEQAARVLLRQLARAATGIVPPAEALQICPHPLEVSCDCRKPAPGMLDRIAAFYGVAPSAAAFVGNAASDREAARRAGMTFIPASTLFSQPTADS